MKEPVEISKRTGKWCFIYKGRRAGNYDTKFEASAAYVRELVQKEPKYKPLFASKTWGAIMKIVGIKA